VVEVCDERFSKYYNPIMKNPKYEVLISHFHKILHDEDKVVEFSKKSDLLELKDMEYMIGKTHLRLIL
jgi:hypothetical protein